MAEHGQGAAAAAAELASARQKHRQDEEASAEEIARQIEERHRAQLEGGPGYGGAGGLGQTGAVGQQAMLPTVNDPKLWMVKCRSGCEREACVQLLQKQYAMQDKGTPLLIKSAFALDHLRVRGGPATRGSTCGGSSRSVQGAARMCVRQVGPRSLRAGALAARRLLWCTSTSTRQC